MDDKVTISKSKLLYDPLFARKPDVEMKGKKNTVFKILFVIVITAFVGLSLFFSFNSISSDKYTYKENDTGYTLYQFVGKEDDLTLHVDYVRDETGSADTTKPVTEVREFSMSCNEYVRFIFIGKDVSELQPHCFYYTKNLMAIIVDPENQNYTSEYKYIEKFGVEDWVFTLNNGDELSAETKEAYNEFSDWLGSWEM